MNWLAHAALATPEPEIRMGNVLADMVKRADRVGLSEKFHAGVREHQRIDAFTDYHPIVHTSRARLEGKFPHLAGIIVDVFYDHCLASHWERYHPEPLERFTAKLYREMLSVSAGLPDKTLKDLKEMQEEDLLASYQHLAGIEEVLWRLSNRILKRMGRDVKLTEAMPVLIARREDFEADFHAFYPLLQDHVRRESTTPP
ncbi:MAG: ACP phosphodiesterase [Fimbriiglobus sp.]